MIFLKIKNESLKKIISAVKLEQGIADERRKRIKFC